MQQRANVIGISNAYDDMQEKFSMEACRNKFTVAADGGVAEGFSA